MKSIMLLNTSTMVLCRLGTHRISSLKPPYGTRRNLGWTVNSIVCVVPWQARRVLNPVTGSRYFNTTATTFFGVSLRGAPTHSYSQVSGSNTE